MILIAPTYLDQMTRAAEAAYPRECCGLLVGKDTSDGFVTITKVVASDNVHPSGGNDRFEVDPRIRFDLMRELGEIGDKPRSSERIIGHYHSHPNHSAEPSAYDLACAFEPALIWIIIGLNGGKVQTVAAHKLHLSVFQKIPLRNTDGASYAIAVE